jgi:hypothetical protein
MAGRTENLVKSFLAEGAILRNRWIKPGTAAGSILTAAAATDLIIGVSSNIVDTETADMADGILQGIANLKLGGTVTYGARLSSDSSGRGITASGQVRVGGIAMAAGVVNDIIPVLIYPSNIEGIAAVTASATELNILDGQASTASTFVIGAESGNVINVAVTLRDADGVAIANRANIYAYFSDDAAGAVPNATAVSGTVAIGTNGTVQVLEAKKQFRITSTAAGLFDLNITESGVKTIYLVLVLPSGRLRISNAITFA